MGRNHSAGDSGMDLCGATCVSFCGPNGVRFGVQVFMLRAPVSDSENMDLKKCPERCYAIEDIGPSLHLFKVSF